MPVTAALIIQDNKILLTRRKGGEKFAGFWEFPGGKVEDGESEQACLARELKEELGVVAQVGDFFTENEFHYRHGAIRLLTYFTEVTDTDFRLSVHDRAEWVPLAEVTQYLLTPADIAIAEKLQKSMLSPDELPNSARYQEIY